MESQLKVLELEIGSLRENKSALEKEGKLLKDRLKAYDEALAGKEAITKASVQLLKDEIATLEVKLENLTALGKSLEANRIEKKAIIEKKEIGAAFISQRKEGLSEITAYITSIETEVPKDLREKSALEAMLTQLKASYTAKESMYQVLKEEQEKLNTQKAEQSARVLEGQKRQALLKEQGAKKRLEFEKALEIAGFSDISDYKVYKMTTEALEVAKINLNTYLQRRDLITSQCQELKEKTKDFSEEERSAVINRHEVLMQQSTSLNITVTKIKQDQQKYTKIKDTLKGLYDTVKMMAKRQKSSKRLVAMLKEKIKKDFPLNVIFKSII